MVIPQTIIIGIAYLSQDFALASLFVAINTFAKSMGTFNGEVMKKH